MIIIPARLQSSRLKNKLLLPLNGIPIIIKTAQIAQNVDDCVVACDDEAILEICKKYKINAILTSKNHQSGTDRCAEAAREMKLLNNEVVINLQGDEPFLESSVIKKLKNAMQDAINEAFMSSCYKIIDESSANDPNIVKVVLDKESNAMYFSRAKIPFPRENEAINYKAHIGIYAFSAQSLQEFCDLEKSNLENIEKLEQLRALENNKKIKMIEVKTNSIGIDTQSDYERALKLIKGQ